jgi:hypothetical protein
MRFIKGIAGLPVQDGQAVFETKDLVSVRVIDEADGKICLRIGVQPKAALLTPREARLLGEFLIDAAERAEHPE